VDLNPVDSDAWRENERYIVVEIPWELDEYLWGQAEQEGISIAALISHILSQWADRNDRESMLSEHLPILSSRSQEDKLIGRRVRITAGLEADLLASGVAAGYGSFNDAVGAVLEAASYANVADTGIHYAKRTA